MHFLLNIIRLVRSKIWNSSRPCGILRH